jgi:YVTN family beta-propeller protein
MKRILRVLKLASFAASLLVLSSCGGGGGGGGSSSAPQTATATMQAGTVAVGSAEVGATVTVSSDSAGQRVLTVQNAGSKLANAQAGQVMVFEASSAMPLGFAGKVQSVQTTSVGGVPTTTATFVPAGIGDVFQNLNLNLSNVATNPQLMAGVALQNGVRAYTKTEPQLAGGVLGNIQSGLIELNLLAKNTNTAVGVDFSGSGGIKASFWKVNGKWTGDDPHTSAPRVDIAFTGQIELQNPDFSQVNIVIENGKLVTHNLQLQGTLKRNIKATVTGNFQASAADLGELFSKQPTGRFYTKNSTYNEISFDYKGSSIKVHGVEKDRSKIILGAAIISIDGRFQPTYGNSQTGNALKTVPVGMVVTFFMTADMQVEATASLGYQWRDMDINAGMGFSYNDSLGLPVSLATGQYKPPVPFWSTTPYLTQPEGVSYDASGSASATLTAGVDGGIVLVGLEMAQATVEGGIRGSFSGQFSKPVGGTLSGCYSSASVTAGVRALLDVAAGVELKTNFKSNWLKWFNTSVAAGYVYEFPMYPTAGLDWLAETTIWSVGDDTCHNPQFSATAGATLYSYSFDANATTYQPIASSYTWDFGDGTTSTGVTAAHTYSTPGNYTATLTVLFSDGIQKTVSKAITVATLPALNPAFTVNFNGLQASFDASTSTPGANITGYRWSFGDGATASGITASHTYAAYSNTPWPVTLTVTDSYGRTASTSQNVSATCPAGQVLQNGQCVTPAPAATSRAYVVSSGGNTVRVIDTTTNSVGTTNMLLGGGATVTVGSAPYGVAVYSTANRAYVTNHGSNTVSVIDTTSNTVVATVAVGASPWGVAVHSAANRAYVANSGSNTVSVIDTASNTVIATVAVGSRPEGVAVNSIANRAYVTNFGTISAASTVSVIDTTTNTVVATVPVGFGPTGVAVHPTANRVYVTNFYSDRVSVIDTTTNTVVATVPVGSDPTGVAVHPTANRVYVTNSYSVSSTVSVIDTTTNTVVATVPVGVGPYDVAVNSITNRAYVTNAYDSTVSIIDTTTNTVVGEWTWVGGALYGVALVP